MFDNEEFKALLMDAIKEEKRKAATKQRLTDVLATVFTILFALFFFLLLVTLGWKLSVWAF